MPIIMEGVYHTYQAKTPYETHALKDINLEINEGEFVGLIGHTGSGKSTLIQHLNGLLKPSLGRVVVDEIDLSVKGTKLKEVRQKVGLVFQYPEHQLFEETVFADIAFGPKNLGLPEAKIAKRVKKAMQMVALDYDTYQEASPFVLSGGEKRRVAIAGVLAMEPKYLILDEPTAGLDPRGRDEILAQVVRLHREEGLTVILVSHSMDDVARFASRLIVMQDSQMIYNAEPRQVFTQYEAMQKVGLDIPTVTKLMIHLREKGWAVRTDILTIEEAKAEILRVKRGAWEMLKDITIGQYIPGNSPIHKLDPRAKIITLILFMTALFMCDNALGYLEITVFTLLIVLLSGVPVIMLLKGLKPLWIILVITFSLHVFMTPGDIIWQWNFINITTQGLRQAIFMVLRLIYLVTITSLLTLTTTPMSLTDGIEQLLRAIYVPVAHELAMMMTIALRFIPTLIEETEKIMKAQMARGADFETGSMLARAKSLIPLLVPLFLSSFRRADELAMAMEARCYRGGENRTRMKQLVMGGRDVLAFAVAVIFLGITLITRYWV